MVPRRRVHAVVIYIESTAQCAALVVKSHAKANNVTSTTYGYNKRMAAAHHRTLVRAASSSSYRGGLGPEAILPSLAADAWSTIVALGPLRQYRAHAMQTILKHP